MKTDIFTQAVAHFSDKPIVTVAAGTTCACLGDERNLREFLIADETARHLRDAGHVVFSLLIDDSWDALNFRQLRVAVNKDERMQEQYKDWCGKPIGLLPDPWGCHASYADHFEAELLGRLHGLGCHPTLISTGKLYERGVYRPYVSQILEQYTDVLEFLRVHFAGYQPEKLFWVLCPDCEYIDETQIEDTANGCVRFYCRRCERSRTISHDDVRGKFNWKLDCALRWALFNVDAEPFNTAYLEPQAGSFYVAQALSQRFFQGHAVFPLRYGLVKMDKSLGFRLLQSLPGTALRALFVEHPGTDLTLAPDLIQTAASRHEVLPGLSYLDFVKQLLPMWLLSPEALSPGQRDLLAHGIAFSRNFLDTDVRLHLPRREDVEQETPDVLDAVRSVLMDVLQLRREAQVTEDEYRASLKKSLDALGSRKKAVFHRLRVLVGQEQGLPVTRFLYVLPISYLEMLAYLLELQLGRENSPAAAPRPALQWAA